MKRRGKISLKGRAEEVDVNSYCNCSDRRSLEGEVNDGENLFCLG